MGAAVSIGSPSVDATVRLMQVACSHCGKPHTVKDHQIGKHPRVQFRCVGCGQSTVIQTHAADQTQVISPLPVFARAGVGAGSNRLLGADSRDLFLPAGKSISLSVISGPAKGTVYTLDKPLVVLGRNADLSIHDPDISRCHCAVEVKGDAVHLRDLDSTNGTFVEGERIKAAVLRHLSEFRLGACVVLVTIVPKFVAAH